LPLGLLSQSKATDPSSTLGNNSLRDGDGVGNTSGLSSSRTVGAAAFDFNIGDLVNMDIDGILAEFLETRDVVEKVPILSDVENKGLALASTSTSSTSTSTTTAQAGVIGSGSASRRDESEMELRDILPPAPRSPLSQRVRSLFNLKAVSTALPCLPPPPPTTAAFKARRTEEQEKRKASADFACAKREDPFSLFNAADLDGLSSIKSYHDLSVVPAIKGLETCSSSSTPATSARSMGMHTRERHEQADEEL